MEQDKKTNGFYVASLVLGIIALVLAIFPLVGFIIGIIALVISIVAFRKRNKNNEKNAMVTAGLVLSIIGFIISLIITIFLVALPVMGFYVFKNAESTVENHNLNNELVHVYNASFEEYEGIQNGSSVKALCDLVRVHNLTTPERSIKLVKDPTYVPSYYTNINNVSSNEIMEIKKDISVVEKYEITFAHDSEGYITWIGIEETN